MTIDDLLNAWHTHVMTASEACGHIITIAGNDPPENWWNRVPNALQQAIAEHVTHTNPDEWFDTVAGTFDSQTPAERQSAQAARDATTQRGVRNVQTHLESIRNR